MSKLKDILYFHELKPSIDIWFSASKNRSFVSKMHFQTHNDGDYFVAGVFSLIQCKLFALHIRVEWWKFTLKNVV